MTIRQHWVLRRLLVYTILMAGVGVAVFATPPREARAASPGVYDGYYPDWVSGCGSNVRAGRGTPDPVASLWSISGYYGWAEQRYSSSGECNGYQWIRIHVTIPIPLHPDTYAPWVELYLREGGSYSGCSNWWTPDRCSDGIPAEWVYGNRYVLPGDYDLRMYYVTWRHMCARFAVGSNVLDVSGAPNPLFFGHQGLPTNDDGHGSWCA